MNEPRPFNEVAAEAVHKPGAVLLDVRRDDEWAQGHAAAAVHLPIEQMEGAGALPDIPKDAPVYTYCEAGGRAGRAAKLLQEHGWTDAQNMGGLNDWQAAGGAVEQ